jgi:hypothetical protein
VSIAADLAARGYVNANGKEFSAASVARWAPKALAEYASHSSEVEESAKP